MMEPCMGSISTANPALAAGSYQYAIRAAPAAGEGECGMRDLDHGRNLPGTPEDLAYQAKLLRIASPKLTAGHSVLGS